MESCSDLKITEFLNNVYQLLLGKELAGFGKAFSIVRVNNEDLLQRGEFSFINNIAAWRKALLSDSLAPTSHRSKNVLEYYLLRNGGVGSRDEDENEDEDEDEDESKATKKALQSMTEASRDFCLKIEKLTLRKERVCIYLNRNKTLADTLAHILARGSSYGEFQSDDKKRFSFRIVEDHDSELTNLRLRLIEGVAKNIVRAHGHETNRSVDSDDYDITAKSRIDSETRSKLLLCGVAKSSASGTKETAVTQADYLEAKLAELADTTEQKLPVSKALNKEENSILRQIAEAAIALEFLSVKPSRSITIASGSESDKSKGCSFILYNTARMSAIFEKYNDERSKGNYPDLPDIGKVDFSLLNEEEEWEIFFNFLIGYPEVVKSCSRLEDRLEICPQYICSFLSRLCCKFSAYYRRIRILTEGRDHLVPTMMARLYLLKALQIVTSNALRLLNIDPVPRM